MASIPAECVADGYASNNPDISGVGVRASFYLQTFLLVLLVDRSWQDAPIALWTFIGTNSGLILAAIILREQLTFFQALQVSNLVWLANFGTFFSLASYSRQKAQSHGKKSRHASDYLEVKIGATIQALVSMTLTLYMWGKAKTFGPGYLIQCSYLVKYVFFIIEVEAITIGRLISIPIISILTAIYLVITLQELYSYRKKSKKKKILPTQSRTMSSLTFPLQLDSLSRASPSTYAPSICMITGTPPFFATASSPHRTVASSQLTTSPLQKANSGWGKRRPKRRRWSSDLDPMLVGIIICQMMVFTYFIVSTELLLKRNSSNNDISAQWSFGQILALVVVIPSVFSLTEAIHKHGVGRILVHKEAGTKEVGQGSART